MFDDTAVAQDQHVGRISFEFSQNMRRHQERHATLTEINEELTEIHACFWVET